MKPDQQVDGMSPDRTVQRASQRDDRDRQRMGQSQSPAGQKPARANDKTATDQNADRKVSAETKGKTEDADGDNEEADDVE